MAILPNLATDPTLDAMKAAMEAAFETRPSRNYIGASAIGKPCERDIWYTYNGRPRKLIKALGVAAIEDGFRSEDVVAARLRMVEGVELWTVDEEGKQFGYEKCEGKAGGHIDGVIKGLLQAPKTTSIWENKAVNETKFNKLKKCIEDRGEKDALEAWDEIYFVQAQEYMGESKNFLGMHIDRHYLTVCTPGARDIISCRTEFQPVRYKQIQAKLTRIINAKTAPVRISELPSFYLCKFCDHINECHGEIK